jgi:hypothetical protein
LLLCSVSSRSSCATLTTYISETLAIDRQVLGPNFARPEPKPFSGFYICLCLLSVCSCEVCRCFCQSIFYSCSFSPPAPIQYSLRFSTLSSPQYFLVYSILCSATLGLRLLFLCQCSSENELFL